MKSKIMLSFFTGLLIFGYACKKDSANTSLTGKWNIVKIELDYLQDSTINGAVGDYYDFASNGALTIKDHYDGTLTGKYSQTNSNQVGITIYTVNGHGLGVVTAPTMYTIYPPNSNSITLSSLPTPGGREVVYLRKSD